MKTRAIALAAIFSITFFPTAFAAEGKQPFNDTSDNAYVNAIDYVHEKSIVDGYDDGSYKPDQAINRAEFTKIIISAKFNVNAIDLCLKARAEAEKAKEIFTDVDDSKWFSKYVCVAKEKGVIAGYEDGSFKPSENINFVEASKILVKTFEITPGEKGERWYHEFVTPLQKNNFIPPSVSTFDKKINRAEMAELIWRISENITDQSSKKLIEEPKKITLEAKDPSEDNQTDSSKVISDENGEWRKFVKSDYEFQYPPNWHYGFNAGKDYLSEEEEYIQNLDKNGYFDVKTYVVTYKIPLTTTVITDEDALEIANRFEHPEVAAKKMEINGIKALRRHFRAEEGDTVNNRETQVAENIIQYTFLKDQTIYVLQYFIAYTREDYNLEIFDQMAESFMIKTSSE